ncbi:RagB/SusD family nutrient uptake outer membrane protein [Pseudopedobacter sp.]|uniref:RagB/SusD family nutrient uptake outer membrane protein n=1 Tax=Pseudopedobacter sp. TaxID=1936787 RepID=UPI0033426DC8
MKKKQLKYLAALLVVSNILSSCKLDEYNPSTVSVETAYNDRAGFEGLINACYTDLYYFYGKVDLIGPTEAGTDSWVNYGTSENGLALYNNTLTTQTGTVTTVWNGLYSMINFCNTAIYYSASVKGYDREEELKQKLAEVYFLRAFANFHLVEQFGDVVLRTTSSAVEGVDVKPKRSSEKEFYDLIISDLKYACENLPVHQQLRGRISKKAAYAMLAKAYLQRTRLGDSQEYGRLALQTAEELINNAASYEASLYTSDNTESGYTKLWKGSNNKNNTEFLFVQAVDPTGSNPENFNRGRTRQYYLPDLRGKGAEWGTRETSVLYGRANSNYFKPTKYLLTQVFEPVESPADTRFSETFRYKFYASSNKSISQSMIDLYGKDQSLLNHQIKNTVAAYTGPDYFWEWGASLEEEQNMTSDEGLAVMTPNWVIPVSQKRLIPALVVDPSDLFKANGDYKVAADYPKGEGLMNMFPAMRKFSAKLYAYTNQYWLGDIPILRLGEVYLIAAEAALLASNDQAKAVQYINTLRKRAAVISRQGEMEVSAADMNIDFILKERARELTGEHLRWYDLKRTNRLTKSYLQSTNPIVSENFNEAKHTKRPIPQSFLDAISNSAEFGNNGY